MCDRAYLVVEGVGVFLAREVVVVQTPFTPASCKAIDDLSYGTFGAGGGCAIVIEDGGPILLELGDAGLAEVLAHHDVGGKLAPIGGDFGIIHLEDERAVGVGDA